ncbi:MAG: Polyribonucleotide nucleotidyltransferase [Candidatus Daviesbacteria bacterium GW2011_GWA1_38_7]|nr:MAG: Polyribonucleotide nucleotidyltransferase [Candidatus Daviesbacteria bacterium GW2011_GWA1_38_7]
MMNVVTKEIELSGRKLRLETGKLAQLADSAVYAGGRITAQKFIKKETRPSEKAVLSGRAIDRSIRPLFPKDFQNEVQVIVNVLSYDGENDPVELGLIGASAALSISSVPWAGPLGVTRVGAKDEAVIFNPLLTDLELLDLNMLVASTKDKVTMIEAEGNQVQENLVFEAIKQGHQKAQEIIALIEEFSSEARKEKLTYTGASAAIDSEILKEVKQVVKDKITAALFDKEHAWHEATGEQIKRDLIAQYSETLNSVSVAEVFDKAAKEIMNDTILNKGQRVDGRAMDEVRPIDIELGILPRAHGSAVFKRGDTQVLSVTTLGPLSLSQILEGMEGEIHKRFMHHYNMGINPFSVGEVKRIGPPNRRDIGHGDLVERGLESVLPSEDGFPYAIRVVSEILAANASTSMASACATTLALLNAGVEIEPVAGIALGLLSNEERFQVITDMRAVEDFYGEMDFKVLGTKNGVTAIQMDTKLQGLTFEIIEEALNQGKKAREFILEKIHVAIPGVAQISKYAPKIEVTHIKPEEIGMLIGPGGKNINAIIARTGAQIDIEDDGTVMVSSTNQESIDAALSAIEGMFKKVQPGEVYEGKVVRIAPFGAFVEILPGKDGLLHVSQMATYRVEKPEDVVSEGQIIKVRVLDVDSQGKVSLSMLFGEDRKPETAGRPSGKKREFGKSSWRR